MPNINDTLNEDDDDDDEELEAVVSREYLAEELHIYMR
jgi:hypothetical protein